MPKTPRPKKTASLPVKNAALIGNQNAVGNSGGPGAPTKYSADFAEQAYELALLGLTDKEMAPHFDVAVRTFHEWKIAHPEFAASLRRGKTVADAKVSLSLYNRAVGTEAQPGDIRAASWWLKNRRPDLWSDRVEHSGPRGGPIEIEDRRTLDSRKLTPAARDALRLVLAAALEQADTEAEEEES